MTTVERESEPVEQVDRNEKAMTANARRVPRKQFEIEARRQSRLIADSPEEKSVMNWISDVVSSEKRDQSRRYYR